MDKREIVVEIANGLGEGQMRPVTFLTVLEFVKDCVWIICYFVFWHLKNVVSMCFYKKPKTIKNEIILVTGGANGIGKEICKYLATLEKRITIIIWDIDESKTISLVNELRTCGVYQVFGFKINVAVRAEVEKGAEEIRANIGNVTMLFNNAGMAYSGKLVWEIDADEMMKVFTVNLISHAWIIKEFMPAMIASDHGHVVETCSLFAFSWIPLDASYIASKHGLRGFVECFKEDLRLSNPKCKVKISIAYPGMTVTKILEGSLLKACKYPFVLPIMKAEFVAKAMVEGVLRDTEYIYIPKFTRGQNLIISMTPSDIYRKILDRFL